MKETKYTPDVIAEALEACYSESSCKACPLSSDKPACCRLNCTAAEVIRNLAKQVKDLEAAQRWTPVTEGLPKVGERVIVSRPGKQSEQGVYLGVNGWWKVYGANTKSVTHWRPMPERQPIEKEGGK